MEPILQPPRGTIQKKSENDHQIWRIPSICSCPNVRFEYNSLLSPDFQDFDDEHYQWSVVLAVASAIEGTQKVR
jgi:hypothetical protein